MTQATPSVGRCWEGDRIDSLDRLARLPARPPNAPTTTRRELPRRRTVSLDVDEL
jgi:hypothetical protein